jgi:hypothetical protein
MASTSQHIGMALASFMTKILGPEASAASVSVSENASGSRLA